MKIPKEHAIRLKRLTESVILEGKHWPEDYIKTAFNIIKNSELGKQPWYTDNYIHQDLKTIVDEFGPLSHKNSNLGYFATIIKWFVQYAGKDKSKYQEFIERKLDGIIKTLLWLSNNLGEETKHKEQIKTKWTFEDFEKYQKEIEDQISKEQSDKLKNVKLEDKGYEIIQINSYEELHEKFGGNKTGYKGDSKWCHTNGSSTYNSWTNGGKYNFFVLAKKDWEKIEPPNPADRTTKAYDEYGTSLIAILVDVASGKLLNATLRWNHVIEPSLEKEGASVDKAFLGWGDLAEVTGKDIEKEIKEKLKDKQEELQKEIDDANRQVNEYLESHKDKIKELDYYTNFKILSKFKDIVTEIKIPEGVTKIGNDTFYGCSNLKSIIIPDSVTNIGKKAFYRCSELTSIMIPDSVTSIEDNVFYGCSSLTSITIPDSMKSIGKAAFQNCLKLTSITLPDSITNIKYGTFSNCFGLTSIVIPAGVTYIGEYAFSGCRGLTSITIPNSVTSIGSSAFNGCSGLTSITIPDGVTNIVDYAFHNCSGLTSVKIPDSVTSIRDYAFSNCFRLTSITIPDVVTRIGNSAFSECRGLTSIKIPAGVTSIGHSAFQACSGLTSIIIPNSVTSIEYDTFFRCSGLTSITILGSMTSIGSGAFEDCSKLKTIYCSEKIWNKFKGKFPKEAERKDPKEAVVNKSNVLKECVLLAEASHAEAMKYMRYILRHAKYEDDIVDVLFRKRNGQIRKCRVHFDKDFLRATIVNDKSPRILKIKKTNKARDNMVVCELLPSGNYQIRTIPLRKVTQIRRGGKRIVL